MDLGIGKCRMCVCGPESARERLNHHELIRVAISREKQLLTHCNGDAASEQLLRCYTKVKEELGSTAELRPVMVHCQTVRPDQLDRMAPLGMIGSFFVVHTYYWGDVHIRNFGERRGNTARQEDEEAEPETRRLYRSRTDRSIAGICGGLADFFHVDATVMRLLMLFLIIFGGLSIWAYIILWIIIPEQPAPKFNINRKNR